MHKFLPSNPHDFLHFDRFMRMQDTDRNHPIFLFQPLARPTGRRQLQQEDAGCNEQYDVIRKRRVMGGDIVAERYHEYSALELPNEYLAWAFAGMIEHPGRLCTGE